MFNSNTIRSPQDPYGLNRFVEAQKGHYVQALAKINCGRKRTHWMWYIFQFLSLSPSERSLLRFGQQV